MYLNVYSSSRTIRAINKSPPESADPAAEATSKSRYYESRYRERDSNRRESERDRDRDRDRRDDGHRSRH